LNKRARLARRILRDHRRDVVSLNMCHVSRDFGAPGLEVWSFWTCPHCPGGRFGVMEAPRAYR